MFHSARLKLTAWYLLIIMIVSVAFSFVIYRVLSKEIERFERIQRFRIEQKLQEGRLPLPEERWRRFPNQIRFANPELLKETKQRILLMLVIVNLGVLLVSGGLGYFLAGRTLKPIKEMMEEQNRFISDASHELRTPLTSLKTAMEVALRNKNLTLAEAKDLIKESIDEVNKLQSLSESLLQLAQYQKANNNLQFTKILLSEVAEEAIKKIEPLAKQKNISIKNQVSQLEITGNKLALVDLLVILLDNAVKYSFENTSVTIASHKTDGFVLLSVKDQGMGIAEKDLLHIFDRFYRADYARTKTKEGGYGLGLSIAKKIIEDHHGSIDVKSKLNKGTTFIVKLPLKKS
jgi:signal transduction histidine kinase